MKLGNRLMAAGVLAAGALVAAGCAQTSDPVDPIERLGRKAAQKAAQKVSPHASHRTPGAVGPGAVRLARQPREMCPGERPLMGAERSEGGTDESVGGTERSAGGTERWAAGADTRRPDAAPEPGSPGVRAGGPL
ncbi:hypothetical protein [Streptomyces odonnellii]|uniref:hypothetical protein n=1 Tax=Streptomyces odonnellii TaxID=1417980 RepID=UPI000625049D|nr:hypothetical protein [Streptomyces odonnellii]